MSDFSANSTLAIITKATLTGDFEIREPDPPKSVRVSRISAPAGEYHSGEVVPVTVELVRDTNASQVSYAYADADTTLTVNGVECHLLPGTEDTDASRVTFGYTVKDEDSADINVTAISGLKRNNTAKDDVTVVNANNIANVETAMDGVTLVSDVKRVSLDLDNVKYGIDDANAGGQVVTVLIPFKSDANKTWVTNEAVAIGATLSLPVPGYEDGVAIHYLAGAYLSFDGDETRYPVYAVNSGGAEAVALASRFVPPLNSDADTRKDTVELFMDPQAVSAATDAEKYLPAWSEKQTDAGDFAFFNGSGKQEAQAFLGVMPRAAFPLKRISISPAKASLSWGKKGSSKSQTTDMRFCRTRSAPKTNTTWNSWRTRRFTTRSSAASVWRKQRR